MQAAIVRRGTALLAVAAPLLLAVSEPPSPTLLNQCASLALMGLWVGVIGTRCGRAWWRDVAALLVALAAIGVCLLWSQARGLPLPIAAGNAAAIAACAVLVCAGNAAGRGSGNPAQWFVDFAWALCIAGVLNALIGCIQVFAPEWADGDWIARSVIAGRAVGNLRQPNHLASLVLWALIAIVALHESKAMSRGLALAAALLCLFAVVLSGSRTGVLGVLLLAGWGLLDRHLSRPTRRALWVMPLAFAALWGAMALWAHWSAHTFGAEGRMLAEGGDISSSRFAIWSNTLALIAQQPWTGVGMGEFNFAWTLTAFPHRPVAFFDHTHNLPLQVLVEFGVPLGLAVIALLLLALLQALRRAWAAAGPLGTAQRSAFMLVLMIGLHSLLEYPLWYVYFLLPTAFAWGFALARPAAAQPDDGVPRAAAPAAAAAQEPAGRARIRPLVVSGIVMLFAAAAAVLDYHRVVVIYAPAGDEAPLEERVVDGQRSPLFGQHADYAAATAFGAPRAPLTPSQTLAFRRAPHQLLDVRLMIAWSQALAAIGGLDEARWLATRIREFRNPEANEYFAPCQHPAQAAQAFQCQPPTREVPWREFVQR
ncbi:MAG: O-antigen ligase C-terminal domain-containing protein [Ideonella sp.]|nr:O-antigen ligase C-terminal domain-containing protein [Ideonella sp.]